MQEELYSLSDDEVRALRALYGKNELKEKKKKSFFKYFLGNLNDPIIKVLIVALIINIVVMIPNINYLECIGIGISILIATLVSTISEYSSENAFEKLKSSDKNSTSQVIRNGKRLEILTSEIVVGDILILDTGCKIPADSVLIDGEISVDESSLTGESTECHKASLDKGEVTLLTSSLKDSIKNEKRIKLKSNRRSLAYSGSTVVGGYAKAVVIAVGDDTFIGKEAGELQRDTRPSPLKNRLNQLAKFISRLGYIAAGVIALAYLFNAFFIDSHFDPSIMLDKMCDATYLITHLISALTLAVSITVVAVPEGLPMMITVVLSSNMKKMARDNVLVRKLVGIETSGNINLLFTDKTGTITEGKLRVKEIIDSNGKSLTISDIKARGDLKEYLTLCAYFCTNSSNEGGKVLGSDATERALLEYASFYKPKAEIIKKIPFDSSKKYSAVSLKAKFGQLAIFKGAPEKLLSASTSYIDENGCMAKMTQDKMRQILLKQEELSKKSFRVIAIGLKSGSLDTSLDEISFLCLAILKDKIRREAPYAILEATRAGVGVVMITGDNQDTAESIAKECGIISPETRRNIVLNASELHEMSDEKLKSILPSLAVVSRALPTDKSRLVRVAQESKYVVGMTGDGVNDAASLKSADVGFSMGTGTEVAKDASDIVIKDNNLASIIKAILYGRTIFESIRKFVVFQLIMNLSAVGISLIGPFIGIDTPVTITQMLWVNIIMDTLGALAFACEPPLKSYMQRGPRKSEEKILSLDMIKQIVIMASYILALSVWFLKSEKASMLLSNGSEKYLLSAFFGLFIFTGVFVCFTARTSRVNLFSSLTKNKFFILIMLGIMLVQVAFIYFGGEALRTVPLTIKDLIAVILLSFSVIAFDTIRKLIKKLLKILTHKTKKKYNIERKRTNVK